MSSTIPGAFVSNPKWWTSYFSLYGNGISSLTGVASRVFLTRLWMPRSAVISRITCQTTTAGGVGTFLRIGLYSDNGEKPDGGALLEDSGDIAADVSATRTFTLTKPRYLEAGTYWIAVETQDTVVVLRRYTGIFEFTEIGSERIAGARYDRGGGYGALTDPCPTTTSDAASNFTTRIRIDTIA